MENEEILAYWTIVLALSTILLAVTTIVIACFSYIENKRNFQSSKLTAYLDIMQMLDDTHHEREEIIKIVRDNHKAKYNVNNLNENPKNINDKVELIIRDWDKI